MKKITVYKSFKDQKRQELEDVMNASPIERIARVVAFIRKTYPPPEKKTPEIKRIEFIRT